MVFRAHSPDLFPPWMPPPRGALSKAQQMLCPLVTFINCVLLLVWASHSPSCSVVLFMLILSSEVAFPVRFFFMHIIYSIPIAALS